MSNIWYPGSPLPSPPVGGNVAITVPNIATLRTVPGASFPVVFVEGYYTAGDGGGGWYYYNAASVPKGCVFQGSITGNVLTVTQINAGSIVAGQVLNGRAVTAIAAGTAISSFGTGTGGTGTYNLYGPTQAVGSALMLADDGGVNVIANDGINSWTRESGTALSYKSFGAYADGATDDTVYMQAAHSTGKVIYTSYHSYRFNTLTMSAGGIIGPGADYCSLNSFDVVNGGNTISYIATNLEPGIHAPIFEKFLLTGQGVTKSNGAGIFISAPTGNENQGGKVERVTVYNFPTCIGFGAASSWLVSECTISNYSRSGISINNTNNADSGDNKIINCQIGSAVGVTPVGVTWVDGGGLIFSGNKVNGGSYGMLFSLGNIGSTSIMQIVDNSIENQAVAAIQFARAAGTATLSNIIIANNEIAINPNAIVFDSSGAWGAITITGNTIQLAPGSGACVDLESGTAFNITGNAFIGNGGGTPGGIAIAAACTNGKIGSNTYAGLTNYITNSSASTSIAWDIQSGTVGPTGAAVAYGSALFASSVVVTFPRPFKQINNVVANVNTSVGGIVGASATGASVTGVNLLAITASNNGIASIQYTAFGLL